jgi:hypothetical protein
VAVLGGDAVSALPHTVGHPLEEVHSKHLDAAELNARELARATARGEPAAEVARLRRNVAEHHEAARECVRRMGRP